MVSKICYFHPYLGKWSNLTHIFQIGLVQPPTSCFFLFASNPKFDNWNHQTHQKPTKSIAFFAIFNQTHPKNPRTPIRLARSFNLRPSSWSWIVKVSSIFAPGGVFETGQKHVENVARIQRNEGGNPATGGWWITTFIAWAVNDESRWYFLCMILYDYKVCPKKLYWTSAPVANLKKNDPGFT